MEAEISIPAHPDGCFDRHARECRPARSVGNRCLAHRRPARMARIQRRSSRLIGNLGSACLLDDYHHRANGTPAAARLPWDRWPLRDPKLPPKVEFPYSGMSGAFGGGSRFSSPCGSGGNFGSVSAGRSLRSPGRLSRAPLIRRSTRLRRVREDSVLGMSITPQATGFARHSLNGARWHLVAIRQPPGHPVAD